MDLDAKENLVRELPVKQSRRSCSLNEMVEEEYGGIIETSMKAREGLFDTAQCLEIHRVPEDLRARMVDWIIDVLRRFHASLRTVFLSVRIMDFYFKSQYRTLCVEEIHPTGVVCMFIASKVVEVNPLRMNSIYNSIVHQKIPKGYLKKVEREVLAVIRYEAEIPTLNDFLENAVRNWTELGQFSAFLLGELLLLDYRLSGVPPSVLAAAIGLIVKGTSCTTSLNTQLQIVLRELKEYLRRVKESSVYTASICKYGEKVVNNLFSCID